MSIFGKIFRPQDPMAYLRKAVHQRQWADALLAADRVPRNTLSDDQIEEVERLVATAGNALAEMNIELGESLRRAGDETRAREHLALAASQARNPLLGEKARELLAFAADGFSAPVPLTAACCPTGCSEANLHHEEPAISSELDAHTHLELLLGSYPRELAGRYALIGGPFLQAFILAHEGFSEKALEAFEQVSKEERDDLFFFERGALLARNGEDAAATADLEQALAINPQLDLAGQTLVGLDLAMGRWETAEKRLRDMLGNKTNVPFALGRLAIAFARRGDKAASLEHALRALEHGGDAETFALAAALLEEAGRLEEAEACLTRLGASGCGSLNIPLAEFWLRRQKHPEKALEAFKSARRQEPDNPRWMVRVAQAYEACGWAREGIPLLKRALDDTQIDQHLRGEAVALLEKVT